MAEPLKETLSAVAEKARRAVCCWPSIAKSGGEAPLPGFCRNPAA
jgi:hypothetical protein